MKFEVNVSKRYFFMILGVLVLLGAGVFVYAYNTAGVPSVMGHSANEIIGSTICSTGQALTYTATGWACVSASGSGLPAGFAQKYVNMDEDFYIPSEDCSSLGFCRPWTGSTGAYHCNPSETRTCCDQYPGYYDNIMVSCNARQVIATGSEYSAPFYLDLDSCSNTAIGAGSCNLEGQCACNASSTTANKYCQLKSYTGSAGFSYSPAYDNVVAWSGSTWNILPAGDNRYIATLVCYK